MNLKRIALTLVFGSAVSGCTTFSQQSPLENLSRIDAHAMSLCGMGLLIDAEGQLKTKLQYALLDNPQLGDDKREGVEKAYDSCLKNIKRGFNDSPEKVPEGFPGIEHFNDENFKPATRN